MKIVYFVNKYPYDYSISQYSFGGSSIAAFNLAIQIARRNHSVNVCTTSANTADSIDIRKNLTIYRYGTNFSLLSSNISYGMLLKSLRHKSDIVHTHFDIPPSPISGYIYAKKHSLPLVVTYHGDWVDCYGGALRRIGTYLNNKLLVDKILSRASIIISPSHHYINRSRFLAKYNEKVIVVPNGVNLSDFDAPYSKNQCRSILGLPIDKKIILFVGHLSPYKGPDACAFG